MEGTGKLGEEEDRVSISMILKTTQPECERLVTEAMHSGEMEGLRATPSAQSDANEYIAGTIDSAELIARARARYGLN